MIIKGHTIWFYAYCVIWCTYAIPTITNAIPTEQDHPGSLFGAIVGVIIGGYVGYIVLKWIYDKLTKEKTTPAPESI